MPLLGSFTSQLFTAIAKVGGGVSLVHALNNPGNTAYVAGGNFGNSVAISGNFAIVGAEWSTQAATASSGKAYVFNVTTGAVVHTLNNPNAYGTPESDRFGHSVAISDNFAIVGARDEDDAGGLNSGKAYVFNVTTGAVVHTLNNPNAYGTSAEDNFGKSVAISGNYAIVGAPYEDDAGGNFSGKAYIFNVTTGALLYTLNNPNAYSTTESDDFGWAVAASGNYVIIGAPREGGIDGVDSGKAYIFNVTTGALVHTLDNPNAYTTSYSTGANSNDSFGWSVAISDNFAIIGATGEDDSGGLGNTAFDGLNSGKAYVFNVTTGALVHTLNNPNAYGTSRLDEFGHSVAISNNFAIIGAYSEDSSSTQTSSKAYIFNITTGALVRTLDNPNSYGSDNDAFGWAVAASGNYVIIGANFEDAVKDAVNISTAGKAYIYKLA